MNILIAVTNMSIGNGGVNTHIIDMCRELLTRNHAVVLVTDSQNCDYMPQIIELTSQQNFKYLFVDMKGMQSSLKCFRNVQKKIKTIVCSEKIDVMHMHSQSLCVIGALIKLATGVPYIWTNHIDEICNPKLFRLILHVFHFPIISVSSDLRDMLVKRYNVNAKRISVVNNGIDPEQFSPLSPRERKCLLEKFHCMEGRYVIGLLARMSWGKGHKYLLEAIDKIQTENGIDGIKVLIAGRIDNAQKNDYYNDLISFAASHSIDVEFIGFQNPRDVFGICNISVLPSIFEGFALTVLESLAMECPVIRSDTPGWSDMRDIVFVFHKKNTEELAQYLLYAYTHQNEMTEMGQRGRMAVLERFTIKDQVDNTLAVYQKCVKR